MPGHSPDTSMNLLRLPPWIFGIIVVTAFVFLAVAGLFVFQRLARSRLQLGEHLNSHVIFFASMIGMFYSLTAGMIAVGVWTSYRNAENIVSSEATSIGCLYRDVTGYPDPVRSQIQTEIRGYVEFLLTKAWPLQRQGIPT